MSTESYFPSIKNRIANWLSESIENLSLVGISPNVIPFIIKDLMSQELFLNKNYLLICPNNSSAEEIYELIKKNCGMHEALYLPGIEQSPYDEFIESESSLFEQFNVLSKLSNQTKQKKIVIASSTSVLQKIPTKDFFIKSSFAISVSDIISPDELAKKLVGIGHSNSTTVEEPGTFSKKGEIFDIYPLGSNPIRIQYFDDMIEEIFEIDIKTHKTNRNKSINTIDIYPTPRILANQEYVTNLRTNIPQPGPAYRERFEKRKQIFADLSNNILFTNYHIYSSLFFKELTTLSSYFKNIDFLSFCIESNKVNLEMESFTDQIIADFDRESTNKSSDNLCPDPKLLFDLNPSLDSPKAIYTNHINIEVDLNHTNDEFEPQIISSKNFLNQNINPSLSRDKYLEETIRFLNTKFKSSGKIVFSVFNDNTINEIKHIFEILNTPHDILNRIEFICDPIKEGFYYENDNILILSEGDLFSVKQKRVSEKRQKNVDLFAEQLSSLEINDYIVHNDHGIGKYLGLESIEIGNTSTDYLVIEYKNKDKVYVPVYKMNLIQKHASSNSETKVDDLRSTKFSALKNRAKQSAKKLAFDLLKLQAERESSVAYAFSPPDNLFKDFELAFPFQETKDQKIAIENVIRDMQSTRPMDHLVCGDVGFGKTEVAMRAAFKAVLDHKQVTVLVPTTVLALQHYNSFIKRFKNFPVNINFLSRFKTAKEERIIKEELTDGKIDIIIGTHKLLSSSIKYKDLGLVIVDEEQRFGVGHKEKMKLLKASVDFLTLTATPIPRTLQLAFLGLKDLSLIQTAPQKRQSIKSYLIREDEHTLQVAIKKELDRGGQAFIIHNRVNDIEQYAASIRELVPEAKIVIAHGQLPEKELEKRMNDFYSGKYQILLSTTIIESGIDIPNANTMIIDRADTYGLSQLHQLRGRIGRSDRKAYAYFVIPRTKTLTPIAEKRLKALMSFSEMGSGFNIANCDLEIRGAGDIIGASQSGHIEAIGLELYMELLKEAVAELKGEKRVIKRDIEISTPFPSYIPNNYITDSSERLKFYKKLSNCESIDQLVLLKEEISDIFGRSPEEINNLYNILAVRINLQSLAIKSIQLAGKSITIQFEKSLLESNTQLRDQIVSYFLQRSKTYQFDQNFKVYYNSKDIITKERFIEFSLEIHNAFNS